LTAPEFYYIVLT